MPRLGNYAYSKTDSPEPRWSETVSAPTRLLRRGTSCSPNGGSSPMDLPHAAGLASTSQRDRDEREIVSLKYAYCRYADARDAVGMASVFAEDCVVNLWGDGSNEHRGRASLEPYFRELALLVRASSHHVSNLEIVFESPDRALLHSYLYSWQRFAGYPDVVDRHRWARYRDVFVRTGDGWRQSELLYLVVANAPRPKTASLRSWRRRRGWTSA